MGKAVRRLELLSVITVIIAVLAGSGLAASADSVPLTGNVPAQALALTPVGHPAAEQALAMEISLRPQNRAALDELLREQQDPASPNYHHWLTPQEYSARFGVRQNDIDAIVQWLAAQGFQVSSADRQAGSIRFSCTVAQAERVFGTTIKTFGDGTHFSNVTEPLIPSQFVGLIGAIGGLNNMGHAQHLKLKRTRPRARPTAKELRPALPFELATLLDLGQMEPAGQSPEFMTTANGTHFGPHDFYVFYDETPLQSSGVNGSGGGCIGVVEDSDFLPSAVSLFDSTFGLATATINEVFTDSDGSNPGRTSDESETLLDLEWSHAVAPAAPLTAYVAHKDLTGAIRRAVNDNACDAIGISFEFCGEPNSFYTGTLDPIFTKAAAQGQSIFVSSGDAGAAAAVPDATTGGCMTGTSAGVSEMAADPSVTGVGGTQINMPSYDANGNVTARTAESVWNDCPPPSSPTCPSQSGNGASGGGQSMVFSKPAYQIGPGVPSGGMRDVPDISMGASPSNPGFYWGDDRGQAGAAQLSCCIGGTSLSAAAWAGIAKLLNQVAGVRSGNINPRLYQLGQALNLAAPGNCDPGTGLCDVKMGTNSFNGVTGFSAGQGYDQATGWGTVDIAVFAGAFVGVTVSAPSPTSISAVRGATVNPGTFTVKNLSPSDLTIDSVTIAMSDSHVFASFSVTPSGSSQVSEAPAPSMTFSFTGVKIAKGQSLSFVTAATVSNSPTASIEPTFRYAGLGFELLPATSAWMLLLGVMGLLMPAKRRRLGLSAAALVVLMSVGLASCGGGGGGGGPVFSSGATVTAVTITAPGGNPATIPANTRLSMVSVQ